MARQKYDQAHGVLPIEWESGAPTEHFYGLVLVEVWTAATRIHATEANKPGVKVSARREARVLVNGQWRAVGANGELRDVTPGEVRRHARVLRVREWYATISLDGWQG